MCRVASLDFRLRVFSHDLVRKGAGPAGGRKDEKLQLRVGGKSKLKERVLTGSFPHASINASYGFTYAFMSTPERSSNLFRESADGSTKEFIFYG